MIATITKDNLPEIRELLARMVREAFPSVTFLRASDLLTTAERLLPTGRGRPLETDLRRAVSTVYYALFHRLAECCADAIAGTTPVRPASRKAWRLAYRALAHGPAKGRCSQPAVRDFPQEVQVPADLFVELQVERVAADYDPSAKVFKSDVEGFINGARAAIRGFDEVDRQDQRAFAAHLLFKPRS